MTTPIDLQGEGSHLEAHAVGLDAAGTSSRPGASRLKAGSPTRVGERDRTRWPAEAAAFSVGEGTRGGGPVALRLCQPHM